MALAKVLSAELIGEGKQLLEALCEVLNLSKMALIKRYAKLLGISEKRLISYFQQGIITVEKLKRLAEKDCGKPYEEIVDTKMNQLYSKIESIREHIHLYNVGTDLKVLEDLLEHCRHYKETYYEVIALGNLARFRANLSLYEEARLQLKEAIRLAKNREYMDLVVFYNVNLAYVENLEDQFSEARKVLKRADEIIKEQKAIGKPIENKMVLQKFWFTYALTMKYMEMYPTARVKMEKALRCAEDVNDRIKCINNIALICKLEGKFQETLSWYEEALKVCGEENNLRYTIMNNIANLHIEWGNRPIARRVITETIFLMPPDLNINRRVVILHTYILLEEDIEATIHQLLELLSESERVTESKGLLFEAVDIILDRLMEKKRTKELMALANDIRNIIREAVEHKRMVDLRARLGDIFSHFIDGGGVRVEE